MAEKKCRICDHPLVKQRIKKDGSVLTTAEKMNCDYRDKIDSHTLQCEDCGNLCYHSISSGISPPLNGCGKCKNCGGNDLVRRPRWMGNLSTFRYSNIHQQFIHPKIWSCPIHGIKPIM